MLRRVTTNISNKKASFGSGPAIAGACTAAHYLVLLAAQFCILFKLDLACELADHVMFLDSMMCKSWVSETIAESKTLFSGVGCEVLITNEKVLAVSFVQEIDVCCHSLGKALSITFI